MQEIYFCTWWRAKQWWRQWNFLPFRFISFFIFVTFLFAAGGGLFRALYSSTASKWIKRKEFVFLNKALKSDLACLQDEQQKRPRLVLKYCCNRANLKDQLLFMCLNYFLPVWQCGSRGEESNANLTLIRIFISLYFPINTWNTFICRRLVL